MSFQMEMEEESVASSVRQEMLEQVPSPPTTSEYKHPVVQVEDVPLVEDDSFEQDQNIARRQEPSSSQGASLQEILSDDPETQGPTSKTANASTETPYNLMDNDHEQFTSWAIHLALILFGGLVCLAVLLAFLVIHNYGLIAMSALGLVILFFVGLALFVNYILKQDARLEPVRRKIQGFADRVQQMVHDEMTAFQFEWSQYLLLTNGDAGTDVPNDQENDPTNTNSNSNSNPILLEPKKKKSVVFRMIKPFLKARKRVFGRKSSKTKKDTELTCTSYEAPTTVTTTTVEDGVPV